MKNTDTTKEEETREVELSVNADKKDNQILEKDLGEARISFIDDELGDMNDILNMGPQKRKSVNNLLPRQGDKGTIQRLLEICIGHMNITVHEAARRAN